MIIRNLFARLMAPAGDGKDLAGDLGLPEGSVLPAGEVDDDADFGAEHEPTEEAPGKVAPKVKAPAAVEKPAAPKSLKEAGAELGVELEEDPGEQTDEEKAAAEKRKDSRIPLSRHKDLLEKERAKRVAVENQLAEYQNGQKVAQVNAKLTAQEEAIVKLEGEYTTLLADGEIDKARAVMTKIRQGEREIIQAKADMQLAAAQARATEQARFDVTLARVEAAYPALDEDHEDFNEKKRDRVAKVMKANRAEGMTPADALQDAVETIMGEAETAAEKTAIEVKARVPAADVTKERKAAAVEKTTKAVQKTPPSTAKLGLDSDKAGQIGTNKPISKMTDKELEAMTDEQLAEARGDHLEMED